MTVEIFVFCGWWFSNQFDLVSETHLSCDTVDRELWLAIISSLLCPETDRNIPTHRKARLQMSLFYLILRSDVLTFHSWHQSVTVSTVILTLGKVEFFKWSNLRNILFIGFVNFEIKQWFSAYQDQFCAWFSLARLPTKTAREFFLDHFLN